MKLYRTLGIAALLLASAAAAHAANQTGLIDAVKNGDAAAARSLLRQPDAVNAAEADGSTALHYAAYRADLALVDALLTAGAKVDAANRYGITPLLLAAETGNAEVIERLLKAGANANVTGAGGQTALMIAARAGKPEALKVLLAKGADVNARERTRSQTALMWAAVEGNAPAVKVLVEAGADIKARSKETDYKRTSKGPANPGAAIGQPATIEFTPLLFAARAGSKDAVKVLLDAGADPNEKLPDGVNGVLLAIMNGHWELAAYFLDRGTDPKAADAGWTALHQVARSRSLTIGHVPHPVQTGTMSTMDLARKLIAMGVDVNARMTRDGMRQDGYRTDLNRIGATPYLLAAKGVDHELMRVLLASGADPLLSNDLGMRPLMVAAGVAMHAVGEDSGAPEDALEAVKVAYEVDKDINYEDKRGHTALFGAARRGVVPVIKFVVEHGGDLTHTMKRDNFVGQVYGTRGMTWTPLTIALGFDKGGQPLFLGAERFMDAAAYLYGEMKKRGISFENEHPESLAQVRELVGEKAQSGTTAGK